MNWSDLNALMPIGVVLGAALIVVFLDLVLPREERYVLPWVALGGCLLGLAATFQGQWGRVEWFEQAGGALKLRGAFRVDGFGLLIWVVALLAGALSVLSANPGERDDSALSSGEYYGLTLLAVGGMMLLAVAHDFLTLLISLEIMSVSTYILAGSNRADVRSNEAALKYLVLGAFSTAFLLLGIAFYYGATGGLSLTPVPALPGSELALRQPLLLAALGLLLAGVFFKIGAAPFHFWIPDVYEGAPTAVTGLMAAGVKAAAFAVVARLVFETFALPELRELWNRIAEIAAVLTMIVGNLFAIRQTNVKRMLAYSAIAHTGYLLLALLISVNGPVDEHLKSLGLYLLVYSVMTVGAFGVVGLLRQDGRRLDEMKNFRGLAQEHPGIALCMAVFMLSLAGLPPLGGFFAKFLIFRDAITEQHVVAAVLGILTSVISLYYYLRVVVEMYMAPVGTPEEPAGPARCECAWSSSLLIYGAGVVTLLFGIVPGWFY